MSGGDINTTELVAAIINQKKNIIEGIKYAQELIDGSMTILLLMSKGIYVARDKMGRTPVAIWMERSNPFSPKTAIPPRLVPRCEW